MSIRVDIVNSTDQFRLLEKDWNDLYAQNKDSTVFLSWDWMFTWWEVFHASIHTELFILCVYSDDELIGIAPFHILVSYPKSLVQGKTLTFIGNGEHCKDKVISQYSDFLLKPDKQQEVVEAISHFLEQHKDKWDFADFEFLLQGSVVLQCFHNEQSNILVNALDYGNRFYIPDMHTFDEFLNQMENRWSKMYIKKNRKLENQGEAVIESAEDLASVTDAFKRLARMHEARWKGRTDVNIFASNLFNQFHLKVLERLMPKKKAFIKTLMLDGEPLSSYYCFQDKAQIHYYQSGFYAESANKYSPLFLLVCKEIGHAIQDNMLFDFMFDENQRSYKKQQYAACSEPMVRLLWSHKKGRMKRYFYAKKVQETYLHAKETLQSNRKK